MPSVTDRRGSRLNKPGGGGCEFHHTWLSSWPRRAVSTTFVLVRKDYALRKLTTAALAAVLCVTAATAAINEEKPSVADPANAAKPQRVTLITGDVVTVRTAPGSDKTAVDVRAAKGRDHVSFHSIRTERGYFVFPSDAIPLIGAKVLDVELFNVERLAS